MTFKTKQELCLPIFRKCLHQKSKTRSRGSTSNKGIFRSTKLEIPFSAIGADHGIEHESRAMKVIGGIKGITNNKEALYRFALVTPEINLMVREFCRIYGLENKSRDEHYQLSGSASEALRDWSLLMPGTRAEGI